MREVNEMSRLGICAVGVACLLSSAVGCGSHGAADAGVDAAAMMDAAQC